MYLNFPVATELRYVSPDLRHTVRNAVCVPRDRSWGHALTRIVHPSESGACIRKRRENAGPGLCVPCVQPHRGSWLCLAYPVLQWPSITD
jgi:hypothetical protein